MLARIKKNTKIEICFFFTNSQQNWDKKAAGMGFGGINPCGQTHGEQKFWAEGQSPLKTLTTGNYTPVPIFAGACANDGTLVLSGTLLTDIFLFLNKQQMTNLRH